MSSQKYAAPLVIELRSSLRLAALFAGAHALTLTIVFFMPLDRGVQFLFACAIGLSLVFVVRKHALLRSGDAVVRALWDAEDRWVLRRNDGKEHEARLLPGSYVHPLLVVLNFSLSRWRRCSVLLTPERTDAAVLRQLRVRLGQKN